jgi:hypothetical protein
MGQVFFDRVLETSTSTGTGDFTLGGAVTGFRTFASVCAIGDTSYYMIEAIDAYGVPTGDWECGFGAYSASSTWTRSTIYASSNANAAVSFSAGNKRVSMSPIAAAYDHPFRGALVRKSVDQTAANYSGTTVVSWDQEVYDTDGFHDNVTNNTRLTIPVGVSKVRVSGCLYITSNTSGSFVLAEVLKNGAAYDGMATQITSTSAATNNTQTFSAVVSVSAGDYFEMYSLNQIDSSVTVIASQSWFAIEVVEQVQYIKQTSFRGALVYQAASQIGANYTTATAVPFDAEDYDTEGFHDNASSNTRLTVTSGISKVKLKGGISISNSTSGTFHELYIAKNGSITYAGMPASRTEVTVTGTNIFIVSPTLRVTPGDYFELFLTSETDTAIDLNSPRCWFSIEASE